MFSAPIRLLMFGREASEGCGKALVEKELDRSELLPGSNLRKLVAGAWLAGGLGGLKDLLEPNEGLEGKDGADLGWVNEGLGWLKDGLGRLKDGLG